MDDNKHTHRLGNGWLAAILIVAAVLIDQAIKIYVKTHFYIGEELRLTEWARILFIENNGMAFGMEFGSKFFLTWFRIIAVGVLIWYLFRLGRRTDVPRGYVVCISLITAGALGNVIDCIFYGLIFNDPMPPITAQLLPPDGGYGSVFNGRVVDMFYFPLVEWNWPQWMPWIGGDHFLFFQPIFNFADACLSVSVIVLILFYTRLLAGETSRDGDKKAADADGDGENPKTD